MAVAGDEAASGVGTAVSGLALGASLNIDSVLGLEDGKGNGQGSGTKGTEGRQGKDNAAANPKGGGSNSASNMRVCRMCAEEKSKKEFTGTKSCCKVCFKHFEAARRDAVKQQELDFFNQINADDELLRAFMKDWLEHTPPAQGAGHRRGGYKFARFYRRVQAKKGTMSQRKLVMRTKKQFVTSMEERGKDKQKKMGRTRV